MENIRKKQIKKVIVNQLNHIISIDLSHLNKNDSNSFSPSMEKLLNETVKTFNCNG